jgi:sulfite reductase beta subunit-like hemoprotein
VGGVEISGLLSSELHLHGWLGDYMASFDLNTAGYIVVGLFAVVWVTALLVWRFADVEARWEAAVARGATERRGVEVQATVSDSRLRNREAAALDACPGVLRLHAAADGHLARVRLPGGRLGVRGLEAIAEAAALGSDVVELTSRASLQVRGLSADAAGALATILARGGLLPSVAHERVRNIVAAPLAGRSRASLASVDGVVDALDLALCDDAALTELPGRFLFAVDDGARALDPLIADVELAAEPEGFRLRLDGTTTSLVVSTTRAADAATRAARAFLTLRRQLRPHAWRVRDLPGGAGQLAHQLGLTVTHPDRRVQARGVGSRDPGVCGQRDGRAAVAVMPPLARVDRGQLLGLAEIARGLETDVRVSPWRTLTVVDVSPSAAPELLAQLEAMGFVVSGAAGWTGLSACAGLGACQQARADVRAAAARRAGARDQASPVEHWSGCERHCGEPPDADVRVVARNDGIVVSHGRREATVATTTAALELLRGPELTA